MNKVLQTHEFALYSKAVDIPQVTPGNAVLLREPDLLKRLVHILRIQPEDKIILFDKHMHAHFLIKRILNKKEIEAEVLTVGKNKILLPRIHWLLPLLERDAFEEAISGLTVLGATSIQPLITHKVHRTKLFPKEHERLERIMIAASEQSKQFVLPIIKPIVPFESLHDILDKHSRKLFFDPTGAPALEMIKAVLDKPEQDITCMVGPEGDMALDEKIVLKKFDFSFFALTPTILRSKDAVFIATGLLRCAFHGSE